MANQEQQHGASGTPHDTAQPPVFAGAARRRFAKGGAAAVGAALTLKSTPGMATGFLPCLSPSGAVSGNISRAVTCTTSGYSPGYYRNRPSRWPSQTASSKCAPTTMFSAVFLCGGQFSQFTLNTLCSPQSCDTNNVARHCVAAYLNAKRGLTPYLPASKVVEIWNEYWLNGGPGRGYYMPVKGGTTRWNGAKIVEYLLSTFHQS
ncbi:hypothetical protein [Pseudoduganella namucuonensis]|uniref:hypothetical protein n=1 Tax=Pseudoduganella namucuonensis TaxID=1035707 RepID=UPI001160D6B0|nr:hypothetical protein [Pseudoduganella namucuonensis]